MVYDLNEIDFKKIVEFEHENPDFISNNLVRLFLDIPENRTLYEKVISNPTDENNKEIDLAFREFYLRFRFISHISSTLFYNSINYDKRLRLLNSRFSLTLDAPLNTENEETTHLDLLMKENSTTEGEYSFLNNDSLMKIVENEDLYNALKTLTEIQLKILNLAYIKGLSDTEIARQLNKSQQTISKTHKLALKKLAQILKK